MWCVVMKSGALPYSSSDYAKAVGVFEFIQQGGYSQPAFKQEQEGKPHGARPLAKPANPEEP